MADRNYMKRYTIKRMFVDILRCAKMGAKSNAKSDLDSLFGMILYMRSVNDITDEEYKRINNLRFLIIKKYNIYRG